MSESQSTFAMLEPVSLKSSFEQILGKNSTEMPEQARRIRWATWFKLSRKRGDEGREIAKAWLNPEDCFGCIYRRGRAWCDLKGLPCTVNPILTFRKGMLGMACMGMGKTVNE